MWCRLFLTVIFLLFYCGASSQVVTTVRIKGGVFNVLIADTPQERSRGLMFQKELKSDAGMLFIFDQEGIYPFWMKNTYIPLDIIWLDNNLRVVYIKKDFLPCNQDYCSQERPGVNARYALELNAGTVDKLKIQINDKADFL